MTGENMIPAAAIGILQNNYPPTDRTMLRGAIDLAIKVLKMEQARMDNLLSEASTDDLLEELHRRVVIKYDQEGAVIDND